MGAAERNSDRGVDIKFGVELHAMKGIKHQEIHSMQA